jgi:PEP-CTERM motif
MSFFSSSRRKLPALFTFVLVFAFGLGTARAGHIDASATGLASPASTITFGEIALAPNTVLTNQYSGLGVSFSPNVYYDAEISFGFSNDISNFTHPTEPAFINPVVFSFSSAQTSAAFQMVADSTPYTFQAYLGGTGGTLVDSFTDPSIQSVTPALFYGFTNETFDTIVITQEGAGGGPFWDLSNIQLSNAAVTSSVPEPSTFLLLGPALAGLLLASRRRNKA